MSIYESLACSFFFTNKIVKMNVIFLLLSTIFSPTKNKKMVMVLIDPEDLLIPERSRLMTSKIPTLPMREYNAKVKPEIF